MTKNWLSDIKGGVLFLLLSLAVGLGVNALSRAGIPMKGQWDPEKGTVMPDPEKFGHAIEITNPLKLNRMIESGNLVLIDARPKFIFAKGHLPGALCFPLKSFDADIARLKWQLTPGLPVVVYCSGAGCMDSHKFAAKLSAMGISQVMVYSGGFSEWTEMGFKVVQNG